MLNETINEYGNKYIYYVLNDTQYCRCTDSAYKTLKYYNKVVKDTLYFISKLDLDLSTVNYYITSDKEYDMSLNDFLKSTNLKEYELEKLFDLINDLEKLDNVNDDSIKCLYDKQKDEIDVCYWLTLSHFIISKNALTSNKEITYTMNDNGFYRTYRFKNME